MKKRNKILAALLAGTLGISSLLAFAGCDNDHLLSAYTGGDKDAISYLQHQFAVHFFVFFWNR